jgi:hypothetical protein
MKKPKKPRPKDRPELFMELWGLGMTDRQIGERMGITMGAATRRRFRYGLGVNPNNAYAMPSARTVNEQPWEPPKGATKRRCPTCLYWFSAWSETQKRCPECLATNNGA